MVRDSLRFPTIAAKLGAGLRVPLAHFGPRDHLQHPQLICGVRSDAGRTGPSGAGRGADGSEPWFIDRMGGRYFEVIDYCAQPPTHDLPDGFDVEELC